MKSKENIEELKKYKYYNNCRSKSKLKGMSRFNIENIL